MLTLQRSQMDTMDMDSRPFWSTLACFCPKKKVTEAEKGNKPHTTLVEKAKEMALPSVVEVALCWSCKSKLGSPSSFFCGHCGMKQVGFEVGVGFLEEDVEEGEEPEEPTDPIQCGEHEEVLGFHDTVLTYERVFHPRPRRLAAGKLWGKGFLKRYHPRQHEKLNLNHGDVRHWFSDLEDPFVAEFFKHPSIRHDTGMMRRLHEFVETREPELASLVFVKEGMTLR